MDSDNRYQTVTVSVPSGRVAEFYEWLGRWLADSAENVSIDQKAPESRQPWTDQDLAEACEVWRNLSEVARCVFELLMATPMKKHSGSEIADHCNILKGAAGVAGTLAWPSRFAYRVGRELPFGWQPETDNNPGGYWMEPAVAQLFISARDASATSTKKEIDAR